MSFKLLYLFQQCIELECAHFIDDLAAARDRLQIPADAIIVLDNVRFHHSALVMEMLELRGFEHKFLLWLAQMISTND
jgi:hypothetical protein